VVLVGPWRVEAAAEPQADLVPLGPSTVVQLALQLVPARLAAVQMYRVWGPVEVAVTIQNNDHRSELWAQLAPSRG
jgi:hypothetical protein